MAELKTYELECPICGEEFTVEMGPEALAEGGECIECPGCGEEWEWEYDATTDILELIDDDEMAEDNNDLLLTDSEDEESEDDE